MIAWLQQFIGVEGETILWWQMSLRAGLIFIMGIAVVRFASTRAFGKWSALDIILAIVVGSNLARAMTGNAPFFATLVATAVLIGLHAVLARASVRWSWLGRLTKGASVRLVHDGETDEAKMKHAGIGAGDLRMALRGQGYESLDQIESVWLERNGDITVVAGKARPDEAAEDPPGKQSEA